MNSKLVELDARELEPPRPLMEALAATAVLPTGATLRLHTRWRPALLYDELEKRGFIAESEAQSDGSFITHIHHS